ncbi:MBL fold metallo-hydrolase [Ideonella sp. YS5]|uniref:MBL fold metallo-hydrolase n=1 Tax=Ideonella sp. YS5 TaxID=3453714 RepID=UPI003F71D120
MKKLFSCVVLACASGLIALVQPTPAAAQSDPRPHAEARVVLSTPELTVHTLMAPAAVFSVTSHVLEFKNQLFVVDGQFFSPYAADLKAYVDKLGKPVTRFYISHEHPDHYLGMGEAFPDVTIYALPQVRHHIEEDGPKQIARWTARLGPNMVAQRLALPSRDAKPGREVVDGVNVELAAVADNESPEALVIKLPDQGVYIAQDLLYNGVHLWAAGPTDGWRTALKGLLGETRYRTFLAGHGPAGDRRTIEQDLAYLDTVDRIRQSAAGAADYKAQLLRAFPNHAGAALVDIYLPLVYPAPQ